MKQKNTNSPAPKHQWFIIGVCHTDCTHNSQEEIDKMDEVSLANINIIQRLINLKTSMTVTVHLCALVAQYSTVQCSAVQYSTVQYSTVQHDKSEIYDTSRIVRVCIPVPGMHNIHV